MTNEELIQLRAKYGVPETGYTPTTPTVDRTAELDAAWGVEAPKKASLKERVSERITGAGEKIQETISGEGENANKSNIRKGVEAVATASSVPLQVASELLPEKAREGIKKVGEAAGNVVDWLGNKIGDTKLAQDFVTKHPEAAKTLEEIAGVAAGTGEIAGNILAAKGATKTAELSKDLVKKGVSESKNFVSNIKTTLGNNKLAKETLTIQEKISPKLTANEVKLAQSQGRLVKGNEPSLLRGGTPDTVIPSDKVIKATETIQREIPNAAKLKEPELYTALEARTADMAKQLQPEMKKVKIKTPTIRKITNDWEKLKKTQLEMADALDEPNVLKSQKQFEARLQKSKSGTMDDLWTTAKEYDASIPDKVKKANSLSPDSLQNKKEIWLQNRAILRDAIKDSKNGMGEVAGKAFEDMHDMYNAKENLLSKARFEATPQASKIKQWIKDNPWKAAVAGYITGKTIEGTTGINIPGI